MIARIIVAIIVGIITAFLFWLVGTLISPIAGPIGPILIAVSYWAGIIAAVLWYFYGNHAHPVV